LKKLEFVYSVNFLNESCKVSLTFKWVSIWS